MAKPTPTIAPKIVVTENGPYRVTGSVPLAVQIIKPNAEGMSWDWEQGQTFEATATYELCRCGRTKHAPFCDGHHKTPPFHGEETASRAPYAQHAEKIVGPTLELSDEEDLCAFARFCDPGGKIWSLVKQSSPEATELAIREANHCPSGRLVVHGHETGELLEDKQPVSIGVTEDPALGCSGPLWVRGGIRVESADGTPYERRNRVTLCRCGASSNKPFCDGSHANIEFKDGLK
jgi:CDGSH-type Zn-finger protein